MTIFPHAGHSPAVDSRPWRSTVGTKLVMAVSALVLTGYMLIHVLGNLLIFLGPAWINGYGALLHATGPLLWAVRLVLFAALVVHVLAALILTLDARRARPVVYTRVVPQASSIASRTMRWTGVALLIFAAFHTPQMTVGWGHPLFVPGDDFGNVVRLFRVTLMYVLYAGALVALGLHMYHGTWGMLRTLGMTLPARGRRRARLTTAFTAFVTAGFVAILVAVAAGLLSVPGRR